MDKFRFLTAGESHGRCLTAIIEGMPAGVAIDPEFINAELARRQQGYGRGSRMKIETDIVEIASGVRFGKTLGSPITLVIKNNDFENWEKIMSIDPKDFTDEKSFTAYRPGHADYAGSVKYGHVDLRNVLERSSARKTAIETAVGAVAKLFLKEFGIEGKSNILQIGNLTENFQAEIDRAKEAGDTLGGKFEVIYENLPAGLGSYVHWDRALDGKLARALMSIPAVKAVEIGENPLGTDGSRYHDEMYSENGKIIRKTNHAGGIEGGMTNGEPLVIRAVMKPIPTMKTPLKTVDSADLTETSAHFERSDVCAAEACAVVAEARIACVLADEILLKFGGDNPEEIKLWQKTKI
ncbi:MAG: chorismate synthase [Heliobacteriaceae bacterium]|jgi:chorismate synthase|nr:chorismate synthase [Heliobacteriaceae bacterium]